MSAHVGLLHHLDDVVATDEQDRNANEHRHKKSRHCCLLGSYVIRTAAFVSATRVHHWKIGMIMSLNMDCLLSRVWLNNPLPDFLVPLQAA